MRTVIVRYRVKPDRVAENEELVRAVYAELDNIRPEGLRYATFLLDDGLSFAHVAETADGANPLPTLPAFQRFQENIAERCDEQPVVSDVRLVGSFKLFESPR